MTMSTEKDRTKAPSLDRRELLGIGLRTAGALCMLPAASLALAGCGSEPADPGPTATPAATPEPPASAEPAAAKPEPPSAAAPPAPAPAPEPAPAAAATDDRRLVTEIASAAPLVSGLQYVDESAKSDQRCGNCQLYTAGSDGRGKCQLFQQGLVKESGWCLSWVAKIS
jgi:hypothetical protein